MSTAPPTGPGEAPGDGRRGPVALHPPAPSRAAAVRSAGWWGTALALAVLSVVLGVLVYAYVQLAVGAEEWPPPAIGPPRRLPFAVAAGLLVASAVPAWWTGHAFGRDDRALLVGSTAVTISLGVVAGLVLGQALRDQPSVPGDHAYASLVVVLVWYTLALIAVGVVMQVVAAARVLHGRHDLRLHVVVDVVRTFWWYVVASGLVTTSMVVLGAEI